MQTRASREGGQRYGPHSSVQWCHGKRDDFNDDVDCHGDTLSRNALNRAVPGADLKARRAED